MAMNDVGWAPSWGSRHENDISAATIKVSLAARNWAGSRAKSARAKVRLIGSQVLNGRRTEGSCCGNHCRKTQLSTAKDLPDQHLSDATVAKIVSGELGQPVDG